MLVLIMVLAVLPSCYASLDCRAACRRCKEGQENPALLQLHCAMCRECKLKRKGAQQPHPSLPSYLVMSQRSPPGAQQRRPPGAQQRPPPGARQRLPPGARQGSPPPNNHPTTTAADVPFIDYAKTLELVSDLSDLGYPPDCVMPPFCSEEDIPETATGDQSTAPSTTPSTIPSTPPPATQTITTESPRTPGHRTKRPRCVHCITVTVCPCRHRHHTRRAPRSTTPQPEPPVVLKSTVSTCQPSCPSCCQGPVQVNIYQTPIDSQISIQQNQYQSSSYPPPTLPNQYEIPTTYPSSNELALLHHYRLPSTSQPPIQFNPYQPPSYQSPIQLNHYQTPPSNQPPINHYQPPTTSEPPIPPNICQPPSVCQSPIPLNHYETTTNYPQPEPNQFTIPPKQRTRNYPDKPDYYYLYLGIPKSLMNKP